MTKLIYGLYADADSAQRAAASLLEAGAELGINSRDILTRSSEPWHEYPFGRSEPSTAMPWIAALGGLAGAVGGYLLPTFSQKAYPIPTGGMPLVPLWTNGIIVYEMAMLGAILATLATLLVSARLPSWRTQFHDPHISEGKIFIGVVKPPESSRLEIERRLREAGADQVNEAVPPV